jgi:hypothetical protein
MLEKVFQLDMWKYVQLIQKLFKKKAFFAWIEKKIPK